MNAKAREKTSKRAKEQAWHLINEHRELFDSVSKEFAVEIIAAALIEFGNERLDELKKIISKTHRPLCSFCGGGYPDSHTREWPIPKCACIRARCELLHAVMGKEEG